MFCAFFKQGLCKKGDKCKFSHDPDVERKSAKRNIYADAREKEDDNMEDWDDDKLADVVNKKHGAEKTNQTDIVRQFSVYILLKAGNSIFFLDRFASTFWTLWKTINMAGFGTVLSEEKIANTDMMSNVVR